MTNRLKILIGIVAFIIILSGISALSNWAGSLVPITQIEYVSVPQIKEVIKYKRVEVPGPEKIITIEKEKIVEKLKLPESFSQNSDLQAIATGVIAPYEGNTNVVATLDTKTGEGNLIAKQEPLPFFAFEKKTLFYVMPAISSRGDFPISAGIHRQLFRVKNVHTSGVVGVTTRYDDGRLNNNEFIAGVVLFW